MNADTFQQEISAVQDSLSCHHLYASLEKIGHLKTFMEHHVFAVWDFMSLLKSLQREITCCEVPWSPSPYANELVRFINEIVVAEESDILPNGKTLDHFTLYRDSMKEIGANLKPINTFLKNFEINTLKKPVKDFISYTLDLVENGEVHEIAASFLYGRESLIPKMFSGLLKGMKVDPKLCPSLIYYIERHIEIDGDEHSYLAEKCLKVLCGDDPVKWRNSYLAGMKSLEKRRLLWDSAYLEIRMAEDQTLKG
ncbi:MAG: DUF3050 domain-containing protein [Bdellovibrionota bacterium]|nr:DUF3050 domain-containing protein [Bdellovibrionota bacterium]